MPDALRDLDDHARVVEPNGGDDVVHELGGELIAAVFLEFSAVSRPS